MRYPRTICLILTLTLSFATLSGQTTQSSAGQSKVGAKEPEIPAQKIDEAAAKVLGAAIDAMDPKKAIWKSCRIKLTFNNQSIPLTAEGDYLSGPNFQHRIRVSTKGGLGASGILSVCDGTTLWTEFTAQGVPTSITKTNLKRVMDALDAPGTPPLIRDEMLKHEVMLGLLPLLQNLKREMVATRLEEFTWQNKNVKRLTMEWNHDLRKTRISPNLNWPSFVPKRCLVYLDATSLWPYRFEWIGPDLSGQESTIAELEFVDPKSGNLDPKALQFDTGKVEPIDDTQRRVDEIAKSRSVRQPGP